MCIRDSIGEPEDAYDIESRYGYSPEELFSAAFYNTRPSQFYEFYKNEVLSKRGRKMCIRDRYQAISVGRVMTCVLGMVVRREREIRSFVKTPFYRVVASLKTEDGVGEFDGEWRAVKGSRY